MQVANTPNPHGLLRLSAAARVAGLTNRAMAGALKKREIPLNVVQIGKIQHVRAAELAAWINAAPAPAAADLFT